MLGVVVHTCNPSGWEAEAKAPGLQGYLKRRSSHGGQWPPHRTVLVWDSVFPFSALSPSCVLLRVPALDVSAPLEAPGWMGHQLASWVLKLEVLLLLQGTYGASVCLQGWGGLASQSRLLTPQFQTNLDRI